MDADHLISSPINDLVFSQLPLKDFAVAQNMFATIELTFDGVGERIRSRNGRHFYFWLIKFVYLIERWK